MQPAAGGNKGLREAEVVKDPLQQAAVGTFGLSEAEVGADCAQLATNSINLRA